MKKNIMFKSRNLNANLSYNTSQFINVLYLNSLFVNENNIDNKNNSYGKLT